MGLALSLKDGSLNLSNAWTRQLSETITGNVSFPFCILLICLLPTCINFLLIFVFQIQLELGSDTSIAVGWQKKDQKISAAAEIKVVLAIFFSSSLLILTFLYILLANVSLPQFVERLLLERKTHK